MSRVGTDDDLENMIYTRETEHKELDERYLKWFAEVMKYRPVGNAYVESKRGIEVAKLMFETERKIHIWRRSDPETFWVDVQLCVKYGLDDKEVVFIVTHHPGFDQYKEYAEERHEYSKMLRQEEKQKKKDADGESSIYDAGKVAGSGRERTGVEVFTPKWVVSMMCDMLEKESPQAFEIKSTFLEPTCGEGAFVLEILRRKFERCTNKKDYLQAIDSVYGMDIEADNIQCTINNVIELCNKYFKPNRDDINMIKDHYIQCDSLKIMRMFAKDEQLIVVGGTLDTE